MYLDLHILQQFAPSNLNRDDTGFPKNCLFGGVRRGRVSSQCWKRAIRTNFATSELLDSEHLGIRTKRLVENVVERLLPLIPTDQDPTPDKATQVVTALLSSQHLSVNTETRKTESLLFLSPDEMERIVTICTDHWGDILKKIPKENKPQKKSGKTFSFGKDITDELETLWNGDRAVDLALFGRMIADLPKQNVDASCHVAHAISTHKMSMEFDYFTAIDDLKPDDEPGADMIGSIGFNSACYYRYLTLDLNTLTANLSGDLELRNNAVKALLKSAILAIPTGKQSSTAAYNPPALVFATLHSFQPLSLANAFADPIRPSNTNGILPRSAHALLTTWEHYTRTLAFEPDASALLPLDPHILDSITKSDCNLPPRTETLPVFLDEITNQIAGNPA